ncbi:hypothetical protein MNBD_GAMMA07-1310 [hydrothermal vent metagenome]|uniref:Uncharacterized protein n=1 Tax=hydrothermal vent metagenome TaxID=652676 RepID=A0A3B0WL89_9ZZZZ
MNDLDNTIPTLLNVKQHGDQDMLNQFKNEADELQAAEDNNTRPRNVQHDIPSIFTETSSNNSSGIDTQDFSEAMQSISNQVIEDKLDSSDLKIKIDKAVKNAMIGIETHLKQQLYNKFSV